MMFNRGAGSVAFPSVCRECKPPKRHVNCHSDCKVYLDAKAGHAATADMVRKEKQAERDADGASFRLKRN